MTTKIAKIRAALERAGEYIRSDLASERGAFEGYEGLSRIDEIKGDLAGNVQAIKALAELENAAAEPVAWIIGKPTHCHEIGRYLAWNAGHVPHSVGSAAEPLYTVPPPAPVAEIREVAVTDEMCERVFTAYLNHGIFNGFSDTLKNGRAMIEVVQSELGPALGMTAWREPTEEECVKMCSILTDWEVRRNDGFSLSPQGITQAQEAHGRAIFEAVREVMGGGE